MFTATGLDIELDDSTKVNKTVPKTLHRYTLSDGKHRLRNESWQYDREPESRDAWSSAKTNDLTELDSTELLKPYTWKYKRMRRAERINRLSVGDRLKIGDHRRDNETSDTGRDKKESWSKIFMNKLRNDRGRCKHFLDKNSEPSLGKRHDIRDVSSDNVRQKYKLSWKGRFKPSESHRERCKRCKNKKIDGERDMFNDKSVGDLTEKYNFLGRYESKPSRRAETLASERHRDMSELSTDKLSESEEKYESLSDKIGNSKRQKYKLSWRSRFKPRDEDKDRYKLHEDIKRGDNDLPREKSLVDVTDALTTSHEDVLDKYKPYKGGVGTRNIFSRTSWRINFMKNCKEKDRFKKKYQDAFVPHATIEENAPLWNEKSAEEMNEKQTEENELESNANKTEEEEEEVTNENSNHTRGWNSNLYHARPINPDVVRFQHIQEKAMTDLHTSAVDLRREYGIQFKSPTPSLFTDSHAPGSDTSFSTLRHRRRRSSVETDDTKSRHSSWSKLKTWTKSKLRLRDKSYDDGSSASDEMLSTCTAPPQRNKYNASRSLLCGDNNPTDGNKPFHPTVEPIKSQRSCPDVRIPNKRPRSYVFNSKNKRPESFVKPKTRILLKHQRPVEKVMENVEEKRFKRKFKITIKKRQKSRGQYACSCVDRRHWRHNAKCQNPQRVYEPRPRTLSQDPNQRITRQKPGAPHTIRRTSLTPHVKGEAGQKGIPGQSTKYSQSTEIRQTSVPPQSRQSSPEKVRQCSPDKVRRCSPEKIRQSSPEIARQSPPDKIRRHSQDATRQSSPDKSRHTSTEKVEGPCMFSDVKGSPQHIARHCAYTKPNTAQLQASHHSLEPLPDLRENQNMSNYPVPAECRQLVQDEQKYQQSLETLPELSPFPQTCSLSDKNPDARSTIPLNDAQYQQGRPQGTRTQPNSYPPPTHPYLVGQPQSFTGGAEQFPQVTSDLTTPSTPASSKRVHFEESLNTCFYYNVSDNSSDSASFQYDRFVHPYNASLDAVQSSQEDVESVTQHPRDVFKPADNILFKQPVNTQTSPFHYNENALHHANSKDSVLPSPDVPTIAGLTKEDLMNLDSATLAKMFITCFGHIMGGQGHRVVNGDDDTDKGCNGQQRTEYSYTKVTPASSKLSENDQSNNAYARYQQTPAFPYDDDPFRANRKQLSFEDHSQTSEIHLKREDSLETQHYVDQRESEESIPETRYSTAQDVRNITSKSLRREMRRQIIERNEKESRNFASSPSSTRGDLGKTPVNRDQKYREERYTNNGSQEGGANMERNCTVNRDKNYLAEFKVIPSNDGDGMNGRKLNSNSDGSNIRSEVKTVAVHCKGMQAADHVGSISVNGSSIPVYRDSTPCPMSTETSLPSSYNMHPRQRNLDPMLVPQKENWKVPEFMPAPPPPYHRPCITPPAPCHRPCITPPTPCHRPCATPPLRGAPRLTAQWPTHTLEVNLAPVHYMLQKVKTGLGYVGYLGCKTVLQLSTARESIDQSQGEERRRSTSRGSGGKRRNSNREGKSSGLEKKESCVTQNIPSTF